MKTRRSRSIRILGIAALVVLCGLAVGSAGAEDITGKVERVGWWSKRLGAQPTVPPASFEVSFGTDLKPTSVAAIDISVPVQPVQTLQISLTELAGTANQLGHIRVCLATPGWATANAGDFTKAPTFDCTNAADLTRSTTGNWLGDIGTLVPNGGTASLGILLVDDLAAGISLGATVQISEVLITGQSADGIAPTDTTATTLPDDGSFVEPSPGFVPPPTGTFDVPPVDTPAGEEPVATTTTIAEAPLPLAPTSFASEGKPWERLVILLPLALGIGFATVYGRRFLEARGVSFSG